MATGSSGLYMAALCAILTTFSMTSIVLFAIGPGLHVHNNNNNKDQISPAAPPAQTSDALAKKSIHIGDPNSSGIEKLIYTLKDKNPAATTPPPQPSSPPAPTSPPAPPTPVAQPAAIQMVIPQQTGAYGQQFTPVPPMYSAQAALPIAAAVIPEIVPPAYQTQRVLFTNPQPPQSLIPAVLQPPAQPPQPPPTPQTPPQTSPQTPQTPAVKTASYHTETKIIGDSPPATEKPKKKSKMVVIDQSEGDEGQEEKGKGQKQDEGKGGSTQIKEQSIDTENSRDENVRQYFKSSASNMNGFLQNMELRRSTSRQQQQHRYRRQVSNNGPPAPVVAQQTETSQADSGMEELLRKITERLPKTTNSDVLDANDVMSQFCAEESNNQIQVKHRLPVIIWKCSENFYAPYVTTFVFVCLTILAPIFIVAIQCVILDPGSRRPVIMLIFLLGAVLNWVAGGLALYYSYFYLNTQFDVPPESSVMVATDSAAGAGAQIRGLEAEASIVKGWFAAGTLTLLSGFLCLISGFAFTFNILCGADRDGEQENATSGQQSSGKGGRSGRSGGVKQRKTAEGGGGGGKSQSQQKRSGGGNNKQQGGAQQPNNANNRNNNSRKQQSSSQNSQKQQSATTKSTNNRPSGGSGLSNKASRNPSQNRQSGGNNQQRRRSVNERMSQRGGKEKGKSNSPQKRRSRDAPTQSRRSGK